MKVTVVNNETRKPFKKGDILVRKPNTSDKINHQLFVVATSDEVDSHFNGVVLHPTSTSSRFSGDYVTDFLATQFTLFTGELIIKN